jgi:hypothetical protein
MSTSSDALDAAIRSVAQLQTVLSQRRSVQVNSNDERNLLKATALSWFQSLKPAVALDSPKISECDKGFKSLLERADKQPTRSRLMSDLKALKKTLVSLRSDAVAAPAQEAKKPASARPPDFSALVPNVQMKAILEHRWRETELCMTAGAHLAATVMMGGLLEGLLLARLNRMPDMKPAFTAAAAPRDKAGKTLPLKEWTLRDYIAVAHELGWIRRSAKDVGAVLRDYRNYIHPQKELSHGISIAPEDVEMFWSIFRALTTQIVSSA